MVNRMRDQGGRLVRSLALALGLASAATVLHAEPSPLPTQTATVTATSIETTRIHWRGRGRSITTQIPGNAAAPSQGRIDRGTCPPVVQSVAANFNAVDLNSEITLQLGIREEEGFGSTYTVPAADFPIEINLIECFFATIAAGGGQITCGYTIEVFDGTPANGLLVYSVTSDPDPNGTGLPGDVLLQRLAGTCNPSGSSGTATPASAGKLQFSVDQTSDPVDRMILNNTSGTGQFTVLVRITRMNQANPNPCAIIGGEEPRCQNIFLCTEANTSGALNFPTRNWLYAISCPSNPFAAPGGHYTFQQLQALGVSPSRDVLQQVTYTPTFCTIINGACCNASLGTCSLQTSAGCGGSYQGDNTACTPNPCPQPTGACCLPLGTCEIRAANNCSGSGFTFRGASTVCANANCPQPTGACCNGTSCAANVAINTCATLGGQFMGPGSTCAAGNTCPLGACCLASGACVANSNAFACTSQSGTFQGVGTTCGTVNCPQPNGACCTTSGACVEIDQATCGIFGGAWQGGLTTCAATNCSPATGICCRGSTCASGVEQSACQGTNTLYVSGATTSCGLSTTTPCCKADFNKVSGISVQDVFDFLAAWFAASPTADFSGNGAGAPGVQSIFDFLAAWFAAGC